MIQIELNKYKKIKSLFKEHKDLKISMEIKNKFIYIQNFNLYQTCMQFLLISKRVLENEQIKQKTKDFLVLELNRIVFILIDYLQYIEDKTFLEKSNPVSKEIN